MVSVSVQSMNRVEVTGGTGILEVEVLPVKGKETIAHYPLLRICVGGLIANVTETEMVSIETTLIV